MNKNRFMKLALVVSLLASCNREPQPSVSPVGTWQGTLTTMTGGSGTQPFTAEIVDMNSEYANYSGVFAVGDASYDVTGRFDGKYQEEEYFVFQAPPSELQPTLSPVAPLGFNWSGVMTKGTYSGGWSFNSETEYRTPAGEFELERLP